MFKHIHAFTGVYICCSVLLVSSLGVFFAEKPKFKHKNKNLPFRRQQSAFKHGCGGLPIQHEAALTHTLKI